MSIVVVLTYAINVLNVTYIPCLNDAKITGCTVEIKINVVFYTKHSKVGDIVVAFKCISRLSRLTRAAKLRKDS